jgi:hypothetical protein
VNWTSETLNITNAGATSVGFIGQVVWFNDYTTQPTRWLEVGDTAGTNKLEQPNDPYSLNYRWERWWYWVDGLTDGVHYHEWAIQQAPADHVERQWMIQWDTAVSAWGVDLCNPVGSCTRKATVTTWRPPSTMTQQQLITGLEVAWPVMNANSNSDVFQDSRVLQRDANYNWAAWPNSTVIQIDAGCSVYQRTPNNFCLNGIYASVNPPPYDNWRNNKPY